MVRRALAGFGSKESLADTLHGFELKNSYVATTKTIGKILSNVKNRVNRPCHDEELRAHGGADEEDDVDSIDFLRPSRYT